MDDVSTRIAVTLEFSVSTYRQIEPEIKRRADAFFDGDPYVAGWIDVTITENGVIKVEANVHAPYDNEDEPKEIPA
jgi:hypothetical protein